MLGNAGEVLSLINIERVAHLEVDYVVGVW
jgi:hypothetical protein